MVAPAAHTSLALVPCTEFRGEVVPVLWTVHSAPSNCTTVPESPTAQTFAPSAAHTALSLRVVPLVGFVKLVPSQCTIVPPAPTIHTSPGPVPATAVKSVASALPSLP